MQQPTPPRCWFFKIDSFHRSKYAPSLESLSITYTANGKRQIQVDNQSQIEDEQIKTAQNNSYG